MFPSTYAKQYLQHPWHDEFHFDRMGAYLQPGQPLVMTVEDKRVKLNFSRGMDDSTRVTTAHEDRVTFAATFFFWSASLLKPVGNSRMSMEVPQVFLGGSNCLGLG